MCQLSGDPCTYVRGMQAGRGERAQRSSDAYFAAFLSGCRDSVSLPGDLKRHQAKFFCITRCVALKRTRATSPCAGPRHDLSPCARSARTDLTEISRRTRAVILSMVRAGAIEPARGFFPCTQDRIRGRWSWTRFAAAHATRLAYLFFAPPHSALPAAQS